MSALPKIGELWIYVFERSAGSKLEEAIVIIDYLDEDVIWFSYVEEEDEDDWCAVEYFMTRSRRYDG